MATERDLYEVLGVPKGSDDAELKRAFRKLAQQWHPDVNTEPGADARFKEINEAYQVLSDPQRRQAYDLFGRSAGGAGGPDPYGPFGGFSGFGDIFDAFFGAAASGAGRRARPPSGADLRYDLQLSYDLPAGTYVLLCFVADDETGIPHAIMGMHQVVVLE